MTTVLHETTLDLVDVEIAIKRAVFDILERRAIPIDKEDFFARAKIVRMVPGQPPSEDLGLQEIRVAYKPST